jgi:hypothetical protein
MLTHIQDLIDRLSPVQGALHNHTEIPACLEGTRIELLDSIEQWMTDPTGKQVYWLTGMAGMGKTTFAQSVAEMAKKLGILGATFLFSHASEDRRDYKRVIPTLVYQLARDPRLRPGVVAAVNADKAIAMTSTSIQAGRLIFDVLQRLSSSPPSCMLIVLDALDECNKDTQKMHGGDLIPILIAGLKHIPFVKVFLTSRPESSIEAMFIDKDLHSQSRTLALHRDIKETTVQIDIDHYLHSELMKLRGRIPNHTDFPSKADIRTLVERANNLFIYARTTVEYISDPLGEPDSRLAALIEAKPGLTEGQFGRLDDLYFQILRTAHDAHRRGDEVNIDLRTVLVTLVLIQQQLPASGIAAIAGVDGSQCREYLRHISALLNYQHKPDEVIRVMHLSFPDFLSDPRRCFKLSGYAVDLESDHLRIVEHCLEQMNRLLRYDMCHIGDPSLLNAEVADLKDRLTRYVSEALQYACRFWVTHWLEHMRAAGSRSKVPSVLEEFCSQHLLHWIEVLSLTGNLYSLQPVMLDLMLAMNVRSFSLGPCLSLGIENDEQSHSEWKALSFHKLLTDAHFLMRDYQTPISLSALHVHHGGVASMPECALRKKAAGRSNARLISEREQGWQTGTTILEGHTSSVASVAFSSDGSRIVSGSYDETVHIWDVDTGTSQHVLEGYDGRDLQSFLTDSTLCNGLSASSRRHSDHYLFVSFFPQMSVYLSAKAPLTSSWLETTEDGYSAVKVTAPGDECVGFHTNVDIERSWIITEIDLSLVPPMDGLRSLTFRMYRLSLGSPIHIRIRRLALLLCIMLYGFRRILYYFLFDHTTRSSSSFMRGVQLFFTYPVKMGVASKSRSLADGTHGDE